MEENDHDHAGGEEIRQAGDHERTSPEVANRQLVHLGITDALQEDRAVDHATARFIAEQAGGAPGSALRMLASTGEITRGLAAELDTWRTRAPMELEAWVDALDEYVMARTDPRPVQRWDFLWPWALIKRRPSDQVGRTQEMGWFGLFRHEHQAGGFIFTADELGCRTFAETYSDEDLTLA